MWGLSIAHWVIVIGVVGVLFGMKRLPEVMKDMGKAVKEVRNLPAAISEEDDA